MKRRNNTTVLITQGTRDFFKGHYQRGERRENPVTGARFVHDEDRIDEQMESAQRALNAQVIFSQTAPAECQPLPINRADREGRKQAGLWSYLAVLYADSWREAGYSSDHPDFGSWLGELLEGGGRSAIWPSYHADMARLSNSCQY